MTFFIKFLFVKSLYYLCGRIPVFKFELKLQGQNNKNIMPVLTVNNKPLPEFDRWDAQRLLNRKNSSDGGSGVYMYNLAGMLRNGKYNRIHRRQMSPPSLTMQSSYATSPHASCRPGMS